MASVILSNALIEVVLATLVVSVAINLLLTFRIFSILKSLPVEQQNHFLQAGESLPHFVGMALEDKSEVLSEHFVQQPMVMVFVSPGCPKCKSKLPEIKQVLPAMQQEGVQFCLVGMGRRWQVKRFLKDTGLLHSALTIKSEHRKALNPNSASPFYLFVDENHVLQASGLLGDENWVSFIQQMQEVEL